MAATALSRTHDESARAAFVALLALVLALGGLLAAIDATRAGALTPVIVRLSTAAEAAAYQVASDVTKLGGQVGRRLPVINGFTALLPASAVARLAALPGVVTVTPDVPLSPLADGYTITNDYESTNSDSSGSGSTHSIARQIGARWFWSQGLTGKGVDVALIDTGLSPVAGLTANGKVYNGPDLSFESPHDGLRHLDTYGHGTHMAGIIAGRDNGAGNPATAHPHDFLGIAPGARVVNVKVANAMGATDVSQVIAAIDWVIAQRDSDGLNIRVINLSFGTDGVQHFALDPLSYAVEQAWHAGIAVVVAAGNGGFGSAKLNNPAYNPWVIAVGASNTNGTSTISDDFVPGFSSTGDAQRNPDLVAPGKSVVSLRVPGSHLDLTHPEGRQGKRFFTGSGTSQAAAVVSGAAALIIDQRPGITPDQLKALLTSTALRLPDADPAAQGNGTIYLTAALTTPTDRGARQDWQRASGTGSLDAARGSLHVQDPDGVELRGEIDIFGRPFHAGQWGSNCTTPDESGEPTEVQCESWSGNSWSGGAWSGNSWSGNSWSGNSWSGNSWSGNSWSGNSWSGNSWSGNSWSGNSWSGNSWSGTNWSSPGWLGVSWGKRSR